MLRLGLDVKNGAPVQLSLDERRQGTYIIGTPLPNYEAWCRLIRMSGKPGERPKLSEHHLYTEVLGEKGINPLIAVQVRENSRLMARPREEVEQDIIQRSQGTIHEQDVAYSEEIVDDAEEV